LKYSFKYTGETDYATGFEIERLASFGEDGFAAASSINAAIVSLHNTSDNLMIQYFDGTNWLDTSSVWGQESGYGYLQTYAAISGLNLVDGGTLKVRVKNKPGSEKNIVVTLDTTEPGAPTHNIADDDSDNVSNVVSGSNVSITGEAFADIYLIRNDGGTIKSEVIDKITAGQDLIALNNLFALETYNYARSSLDSFGSGVIATDGLIDGTYEMYQVDRAGNVSVKGSISISVDTDITTTDYIDDVEFASIIYSSTTESDTSSRAGDSNYNTDTAQVLLNLNDVSIGDEVELFIDGNLAYSTVVTKSDIQSGTLSTELISMDGFDERFGTTVNYINLADDVVVMEVKVKHDGRYVQDNVDVTWEYQW